MWQVKTSTTQTSALLQAWASTPAQVRDLLSPIRSQAHYQAALATFESLWPEVEGKEEPAPEVLQLFHLLGDHLHAYEQRQTVPDASGREVLHFLMEQHGLKQAALPEVGSQGVVSEVLSGKRELNIRQAKALGARFGLDFAVFLKQ